ncbi:MAG: hypothetical protein PVI33_05500 [Candidatus Omnitrophota bacterium]|jgi:uncharacterized repeat protein (TIGR04076 family)
MMQNNLNQSPPSLLCKTALINKGELLAISSKKGCRYHRHGTKTFYFNQLTPDRLCIHAFHSAYATCLRLLYTQTKDNSDNVFVCPSPEESIKFKIITMAHTNIKFKLINAIKYLLRLIGIPCDYQLKRIFIKVAGGQRPCPMGHKQGDVFEFNLGNKQEICPASFECLYPTIYALNIKRLDAPFSKIESKQHVCINCPSHKDTIKYDISD